MQAMSRIVQAEVFEVEASFATPYALSKAYGTLATTRAVILKLTDAEGFVGWGEANPMQPFTKESPGEARQALRDVLLPALLQQSNPEPGRIDRILDAALADHLCAKGSVSMALLDLSGKRLGVSVASLLGGAVHASLPVLWPLGAGSAEDDVRVIEDKAPQGFTTFMLKMGAAPVSEEIRRVVALEARYGASLKFIADANQGWTREEAHLFLSSVGGSALVFVEQPLAKEDLD
ncbi:hypothetical protein LTR94_028912, partial [Friedmanniomyces endolithicus]